MPQTPKVLVIAEAANPEWVSVPLVGWSLANALRDVADVHIVTHQRNRDAITRAGLVEGTDFTAIKSDAITAPLYQLARILRRGEGTGWTLNTAAASISYPYFEHLVWRRFSADIRAGRFNIVHRVTPLSPTAVSSIAARAQRSGARVVLGPLNGGVPWPAGYDKERRQEREWLSYVRGLHKLRPGRRASLRQTDAIIVGSDHTGSEIPTREQPKCIYIPENAIDPVKFNQTASQRLDIPLRGCFVGRLVPYKGPDLLLEAAEPLLQAGVLMLDIVGDGPLAGALAQWVANRGLEHAVALHGRLPHTDVQAVLAQANLLTFPSIREFGGGVVLEAMALGVVPLVVDYAGPGELVRGDRGYKIPIAPRPQLCLDLRAQLKTIIDDPSDLPRKGMVARAWVHKHLTWSAKARQIREIYDWTLSNSDTAPKFFD